MQIATARRTAERYLENHLIRSVARRPSKDARVMARYPAKGGNLILAASEDELREKLAKKMQAKARKSGTQH